jgi:hypothetical protein
MKLRNSKILDSNIVNKKIISNTKENNDVQTKKTSNVLDELNVKHVENELKNSI